MLALLAEDVADIPPELLDEAIARHVATSPYMPRAAELRRIAETLVRPAGIAASVEELCERRNASMQRGDIEWFVDSNGDMRLRHRDRTA